MDEGRVIGFPRPMSPLVGRIAVVATATALLAEARLAVEFAGGRPDPVFVDLAPLRDPGQVLPASASLCFPLPA